MANRIADIRPGRNGRRPAAKPPVNGEAGANGHARADVGRAAPSDAVPPQPLAPVGDGEASPQTTNGKDAQTGRFTAGNRYGRGNPFARRQAEMRRAFQDAVTPEDVRALAAALWAKARGGDVAAAQLALSYLLGKPGPAPDPDRLDLDEFRLLAESPTLAEVLRAYCDGIDPAAASTLIRMILMLGTRKDGKTKAERKAATAATAAALNDAFSPDELAAAFTVNRRVTDQSDEAEDEPRHPLNLQLGELRKTRCKTRK